MTTGSPEPKSSPSIASWLNLKLRQIFFPGSRNYWEARYGLGGNSGAGSFGKFAEFKAGILNDFVQKNHVRSVIEFGCGDGHQLSHARYPEYIGLDVSPSAIGRCTERFKDDPDKSFFLYSPFAFADRAGLFKADLSLSLDVIYHLVEDDVYQTYMGHLFGAAGKYVIVYASDVDQGGGVHARHVRHRNFTRFVEERFPGWNLAEKIKNPYPGKGNFGAGSFADFFIYQSRNKP
ncbi:MAG: class I SAM-dependent methyltransferase [Nitrospinaceae bacterium]